MGSTKAAPVSPSPAGLLQGAVRGAEQAAPRQPRAPALPRGCPRLQGPGPVGALTRSPNAGWCQPAPPAHLWLSAVGPWAARGVGVGARRSLTTPTQTLPLQRPVSALPHLQQRRWDAPGWLWSRQGRVPSLGQTTRASPVSSLGVPVATVPFS